jgi:HlyD family secretion protein
MKLFPLRDQLKDQKLRGEGETKKKHLHLPKIFWKPILYLTLAVGVLLLIVAFFRPAPIAVDTGQVERGTLQVSVAAEGKTRIHDRFLISATAEGNLDRISLEEGDLVEKGAIVARIDPLPLNASVREALGRLAEWRAQRAGVATLRPKTDTITQARRRIEAAQNAWKQSQARAEQARAALAQAQRDRQRAQQLEAVGAISRQEREAAELEETNRRKEFEAATLATKTAASEIAIAQAALKVLQAQQKDPDYLLKVYDARIASTEAELTKLKDEAARTEIYSPVKGKVLRILKKSAQFVADGTPLLELGDPDNLELVIDVLSSDAQNIQPKDPILIERGGNDPPLRAQVRSIEPSGFTKISALGVEEQRVNVIGDFIDSARSFGDAYRVDVQIITWQGKNVLKVPLSALFRCGQSWCVFTVQDGRVGQRPLQVGHRSQLEAEVRQGLKEGETVILHPTEQIEEGKRVKLR